MSRPLPTLRGRLTLLVLLPLLPALAFAAWLLAREYRQEMADTQRSAALATRALAFAVDQKLDTAEAGLRGLAASPALAAGRLGDFHAEATAVARASGLSNILLVAPGGEHLMNTLKPWGTPLPLIPVDPAWQRMIQQRSMAARLVPGVLLGQPVVVVAIPAATPGRPALGLGAVVPLTGFQSLLEPAGLPSRWVVAVLDADHRVVARSHDAERFVGQLATPSLREAMSATAGRRDGFFEATALDGTRTQALFARGPRWGWTVVVGVPEGSIGRPVGQSIALLAALALSVVAAGLALDVWLGRRLGRDLDELVRQSDRLGSGELAQPAAMQFREGERIAGAIGQAGLRMARARDALERKNEDLRQFAYAAAHDLHAPLRTVRSLLDVVRQRHAEGLGESGRDLLDRSGQAVDRLHRMTRDLLMFAMVDRADRAFAPVDLSRVAAEALAALRSEVAQAGAQVELETLPTVYGDAAQLLQLMLNLVSNALRFRGEGPCRVRIGAAREESGWRIWIMDNGIGIAPQHREQVFGLFKQLGHGSRLPGTGIGLALCRRIVEHHGGRIWVVSRPGQGSTFFFTLPSGDDHAAVPAV